jgi:chromate reductase
MSSKPKILAFAGSTRTESFNKKLMHIAADAAEEAGAAVTRIDLRDLPMPLYDGDFEKESGIPENGKAFMNLLLEHQGLLISSPEYNSSIPAVLKNAIDWASRPVPGQKPLAPFEGKVAALLSASPGALGGQRGLVVLRMLVGNMKVLVLPEQFSLAKANEAFDADGLLLDEKHLASAQNVAKRLCDVLTRLRNN